MKFLLNFDKDCVIIKNKKRLAKPGMYDYHKGTGYISGMNHREMVIFTEMISYSADTG